MKLTVLFTDVYDGHEYRRTETIDTPAAPADVESADFADWAYDHIRTHTGRPGQAHHESGYFAEIKECDERPDLVGHEFEWGI
mgnify:CR=1 FL=1